MGDFSRAGYSARTQAGSGDPNFQIGVEVFSSSVAHQKGNWVTVIPTLQEPASGLFINTAQGQLAGHADWLMDIGIGTPPSTGEILIPNIPRSYYRFTQVHAQLYVPISIPAGANVMARVQSNAITRQLCVGASAVFGDHRASPQKYLDIGATTATSRGIEITPSANTGVKSAWVDLVTSLSRAIHGFFISFGVSQDLDPGGGRFMIDIGIGTAGQEQIIVPDYLCSLGGASGYSIPRYSPFIPISIAAGTRITIRGSSSDSTPDICFFMLHGGY